MTGIARGIAFQIDRSARRARAQRVAEDVKGLDQDARAALRKHGVRFGAYHLYLPDAAQAGAARARSAALGAQARRPRHSRGSTSCRSSRPAGARRFRSTRRCQRRSIATVGYRVCGERAVRVDILERLADLIRPGVGVARRRPPKAARAHRRRRVHRHVKR